MITFFCVLLAIGLVIGVVGFGFQIASVAEIENIREQIGEENHRRLNDPSRLLR